MDVHAPDHPVLTFKQFIVHIFIVTLGIVIALSLEGAREWWHHREVVHETRLNLRKELEGNQKSIQTVLNGLGPARERFIEAIESVNDPKAHATELATAFNPTDGGLLNGLNFAWLNTASYKTAQVTGALALMEYGEAFKYSDIYDLQDMYVRTQEQAETELFTAYMFGTAILDQPSTSEIESADRQLRLAVGRLIPMQSLATRLNELYGRALKSEEE